MKKRWLIMSLCLIFMISSFSACAQDNEEPETTSDHLIGEITDTKNSESFGTAGEISAYDAENSHYLLTVDAANEVHEISDLLFGIFIEDINFAADGGLYAELIQNRSFEFKSLAQGNEKHAWSDIGGINAVVTVDDAKSALNRNNTNYMVMENSSDERAGIANKGFLDGIAVEENAAYDFFLYAKGLDGYTGTLYVDIMVNGDSAAHGEIPAVTDEWTKYELELVCSKTASSGVTLQVTMDKGKVAVDMVSLFPQDTYKGRKNGLRKDLAEKLEALTPAFLRFPGGCVVEGVKLDLAYDWKDSVGIDENRDPLLFNGTYGDVAARSQGQNIWTNENTSNDPYPSFMSYGLGFYEYFQLAEDIGAIGVPVINCGLCCMAQGNGSGTAVGTAEFEQYIDDALDLVEFCRGDDSTVWGRARIAMGHEEPFGLKYIAIGNEQWGNNFYKHYEAFVDAFAAAAKENPEMYGDIELIYSAGTDDGDSGNMYLSSYEEAEKWLDDNPGKTIGDFAGATDHHYYNDPDWFLKNANYYDHENYSRTDLTETRFGGAIPVFLGEYASFSNTMRSALAEAAYMTGLERNGDIVVMAAYAPLFGNLTATHWAPDLIWFNNHTSTASVNYYVQQIFAKNAGTTLLQSELIGAEVEEKLSGKIGVGTWNTSAYFDNIKIVNTDTGEVLGEQDFESDTLDEWQKVSDGNWSIEDGKLYQNSISTNTGRYANTGTAMYFGDTGWTNYTLTLEATKTGGQEGFLIPFSVKDKDNNCFWNIGGWNNTVSTLQIVSDGSKSDQVGSTTRNCVIKTNQTYQLKIKVTDDNVKCYIDDQLYVDYDLGESAKAEAYQVVSTDDSGDIIIKLVNVTGNERTFAIDLQNADIASDTADVDLVAGASLADDNILGQAPVVTMQSSQASGITSRFNYTVPKYSVTVLRIKTN